MGTKYSESFLETVVHDDIRKARTYLDRAFMWTDSPQGYAAWKAVSDALDEILNLAE